MANHMNKKKRILEYTKNESNDEEDYPQTKHSKFQANSAQSKADEVDDRPSFSGTGGLGNIGNAQGFASGFVIQQDGATKNKGVYSDVASKLMAKMGHKAGTGLGKHAQGRVDIVESSMQKGRRGLGVSVAGFEVTSDQWDFDKEEVPIREEVSWLPPCERAAPDLEEMKSWMVLGKRKLRLDDENQFCDPSVLEQVLRCKSVFDNLEGEEMRKARTRSNPYETIRGAFFLNRAAMKMANMDALLDFMFTSPKTKNGRPMVGPHELLYFADVCAGPGGFSEYVLWRKGLDAKGFGFTLKGPCDFKLEEFFAAPSEFFEPHYGVGGLEGDGDIYKPDNLLAFQEFVKQSTDDKGLHFMMADGGFSVEGQENLQEILSKRLYLCQFLCALMNLRTGGHFVCKLFDLFTPFSVGLVYLMYRAFEHVTVIKPVTSRPANSERYIVCKWKRENATSVEQYMWHINKQLDAFSGALCEDDVTHIVPLELMEGDQEFFNYIYESNNVLGEKQCVGLVKIQTFAKNTTLHEHRQSDTRDACLKAWRVPDKLRQAPDRTRKPEAVLEALTGSVDLECLQEETRLETHNLTEKMRSAYDYKCFVRASDVRYIIIAIGKLAVWRWDGRVWRRMEDNLRLELPVDTVLEVELVQELRGEGKGQRRVTGLHVIDAMFLCGQDLRSLHFMERNEKLRKFVKALNRPTIKNLTPIRVKDIYRCEDIDRLLERLSVKRVKGGGPIPRLCYCCCQHSATSSTTASGAPSQQDIHFLPHGVCFIRTVADPYMMAFSKSQRRKYYFNTQNRQALFETPSDSIADFTSCQKQRLYWAWDAGVKLLPEQETKEDFGKLSRDVLLDHIHGLLPK